MSDECRAGLPAPRPENFPELAMIKLAVTVMHVTVFFSLLGLGYPAEQALALAVAVGLGNATVADRYLTSGRDKSEGSG